MHVEIGIADLIACCPVTDHQQRHVALRPVDEAVRVAGAGGKAGAHPRSQHLRAVIGLQHDLALEHIDEFVLARVGVPERGLPARDDAEQIDAEILQSRMIAEPAVVAGLVGGAVLRRVVGEIALAQFGRIECGQFWF